MTPKRKMAKKKRKKKASRSRKKASRAASKSAAKSGATRRAKKSSTRKKRAKKTSRAASKSAAKSGAKRRKKRKKTSRAASKSAAKSGAKRRKRRKKASGQQLMLDVLGEPRSPALGGALDPQEAEDNRLVATVIAEKNRKGIPLTRREMAAYKRWLNRNIVRFRDAGMRALPQKDLEGLLQTPRKVLLEWEEAGMPRNADKPRTYDLYRVIAWVKDRWLSQAKGAPTSPDAVNAKQRKLEADARKREIEVEVLEHSLIPRAEASSDRVALVKAFTAILNRLPTDFRSAFASVDVAHQGEWLDEWQVGEREQLITQGGTA